MATLELFFRTSDRLQMEGCMHAIGQESKSLILRCFSPGLLDHYGQLLIQKIRRELPETQIEVFFPADTESLIARFNDVLEHLSVDAAAQLPLPCAPLKIWVVHDAHALPEHEVKLLMRLIQHFPGSRIAALLMELADESPSLPTIDPQGKRILRWAIDLPDAGDIEHLLTQARPLGREFAALELIARLDLPKDKPAEHLPAAKVPVDLPPAMADEHGSAHLPAQRDPTQASSHRLTLLLLGLLLMLAMSTGLALWLHPEILATLHAQLASDNTPQTASAQAADPALSASAAETSPASSSTAASEASSAASATPSETAASTPLEPASTAAPRSSADTARPAELAEIELPEVALRGQNWLARLPEDSYLIEHALLETAQSAQKRIGVGVLANARVLAVRTDGEDKYRFMVITGPFKSEERARTFISKLDKASAYRIHSRQELMRLNANISPKKP